MANGLLNLQTDLKSLRYGSDKPYVTKDINNPPSSNQTGMQITKRVDDVSRIAQMLVDRPGLKFIGNQALLQQVDIQDKISKAKEGGKTTAGAIVQQAVNTAKQTAQILGSTIAQIPVNGTGTHFVYAFRTDTYLQPAGGNTRSAFAQFFGAGGVEGAPLALRGQEITGKAESKFGEESEDSSFNISVESKYDYKEDVNKVRTGDQAKINAQVGNPVGVGGVKDTTLISGSLGISNRGVEGSVGTPVESFNTNYSSDKPYKTATEDNVRSALTGSLIKVSANDEAVKDSRGIGEKKQGEVEINGNNFNTNIRDFRTGPTSFNYSSPTINKETRVNLGNQGKRTGNVSYSTIDQDKIDRLNALDISNSRIDGTNAARDLAKFYFEIITPDETKFLHFRAHIDSIDDSYSGDWDSHQYVGRAEEFFTYKGFKRDINVSFKIAAQSRAEMKPLYRKMVYLASTTAPTYGGGSNFMRGTLARLTIGSYFAQIPGIITSVKYTWQQDYMWEIAMQNPEGGIDDDQQELPMALDCSISFKPIHDFAPQTGLKHFFTSPNPLNGSKPFF